MRITPYLQNKNILNNKQQKPSFGTTHRYYKTADGDEIGTNTWMFRDDI